MYIEYKWCWWFWKIVPAGASDNTVVNVTHTVGNLNNVKGEYIKFKTINSTIQHNEKIFDSNSHELSMIRLGMMKNGMGARKVALYGSSDDSTYEKLETDKDDTYEAVGRNWDDIKVFAHDKKFQYYVLFIQRIDTEFNCSKVEIQFTGTNLFEAKHTFVGGVDSDTLKNDLPETAPNVENGKL